MSDLSTNRGKLGGAILVVFLLAGTLLIASSLHAYWLLAQAQTWPGTPGKVVESTLTRSSKTFRPVVRYEYTIRGIRYFGGNWRFGPNHIGSKDEAEWAIVTFPLDSKPTVFVNPADPSQSVLDRKQVNGNVIQELLGGIVMLGMGLIIPICLLLNLLRGGGSSSK